MNPTFQLGRIAGIRIGVDWSWLIVFTLIVWTLAAGVFPEVNPGLSTADHVAMAIVAAMLFCASIVLHELGHALQARRERVEIEGITLWLFGGVAQMKGMYRSPGSEFRIAIAGPAVSLALGLLFVGLAWALDGPQQVDAVSAWLGYINLTLLAFNLLPALPLDGGRVLRAALWRWRRDLFWATEVATTIGRGFGYLLIAGGVVLFIVEGVFSGAWLAFMGWFLLQAATAEARYVASRGPLGDLQVRDLIAPAPVAVAPELTIGRFMDEVARPHPQRAYPVVVNGRVEGLLSLPVVAKLPRAEWDRRRVGDRMLLRAQVPVFAADTSAVDALAVLVDHDGGQGLVLAGDRLVGVVTLSDLARAVRTRSHNGPTPA